MPDWRELAATGLGLGRAPFAPGTAGSGGAALLAWAVAVATHGGALGGYMLLALAILLYPSGRNLAEWAEQKWGEDPERFVLDEVAGYLLGAGIIWLAAASPPSPTELVALFVLFRAFDILKPWPVSRLEEIGGGDGVMLDDIAAGILAAVVLLLLPILF